jgi:ParB/RepB/Spo0J family partition protein
VQPVNRLPAEFAARLNPSSNGNGNGHLPLPSSNGQKQQPHAEPPEADVVQEWEIGRLQEYPKQALYFPDESHEADRELAADIEANGLQEPIKIRPDGTILSGHRRIKAVKSLGWTQIDVIVLDVNDEAAEAIFLDDNYLRRQLTDLQKARCAKRRVELAKKGTCVLPEECRGLKKTRDKIGKLLNCSGRQVDRYLRVLETPSEVQHAVDAGHLSMQEAGRVANLEKEKQRKIAAAINKQGFEAAKAIVKKALPSKAATHRGAEAIWWNLARPLKVAVAELSGHVEQIGMMSASCLALIRQGKSLFDELEQHAAQCVKEAEEDEAFCSDVDDIDHGEQIDERLAAVMDTMSTGQKR